MKMNWARLALLLPRYDNCSDSLSSILNINKFLLKSHLNSSINLERRFNRRMLFSSNHHNQNESSNDTSMPVILYVQNPIRWIKTKIDFRILQKVWDPDFRETDFKDGAKFAISSITQIMSSNKFDCLSGLLTSSAIRSLRYEVETKWTDAQRCNVVLHKEDIKVVLPQRVRFLKIAEKKFCMVDVVFLVLKQNKYEGEKATIFMEIKARFYRDYTGGLHQDWTVSMFEVARFNIIPRK